MHGIKIIIGEGFHVIEQNPVHDKNRKPYNKFSAGDSAEIGKAKNTCQYYLVCFKANQYIRNKKIQNNNTEDTRRIL